MKRGWSLLIVSALGVCAAMAQEPREELIPIDRGPQGEAKLRWVCERLDLTDEQWEQVNNALIPIYNAEIEAEKADGGVAIMQRIQELFSELQDARSKGDQERANDLRRQIREAAPGYAPERNFFNALNDTLTPEQQAKLPALREQVRQAAQQPPRSQRPERPAPPPRESDTDSPATETQTPAQALRPKLAPVHVLEAAFQVKLSPDQARRIERMLEEFRTDMRRAQPKSPREHADKLDQFITNMRNILTRDQLPQFDRDLVGLRKSPPVAQPIALTTEDGES